MVEEKIDISFREEDEDETVEENNIRDINVTLRTDDEGNAEQITPLINGFLLVVISKLETTESIQLLRYDIKISLEDIPNLFLFNETGINQEEVFIPIKVDYYNVNEGKFQGQADFWALNDKLRIQISGLKNRIINMKLRYKKW